MAESLYSATLIETEKSSNKDFALHSHNSYEIYMFLEGDSKYIIEGESYDLSHGDIIIIRKNEMHKVYHNSETKYHRLVIMVSQDFFSHFNCKNYENAFLNKNEKLGNKINADVVHSSGLFDAIKRLEKYSDTFTTTHTAITNSILIEILHIINDISLFENAKPSHPLIKDIIGYINEHYTEEITLEIICNKFFISKYHLCHIFKESTGLTIHQYINQKRLVFAKELVDGGKSLSQAALIAGYNDYSSFYRAYVKKNNCKPTKNISI